MKATLIDHMGSDLTVVNAARVSFAKKSAFIVMSSESDPDLNKNILAEGDQKLISYLAKHNHWTPFGHCQAQFHIKAPIFVARQAVKHQVGLVWNEVSRRYVDDTPEFWWPDDTAWRKRADNKKQGSSEETVDITKISYDGTEPAEDDPDNGTLSSMLFDWEIEAIGTYKSLLIADIAPELARIILPQNMYTEWYWTGSLAAWARVCKLRLDPHAQKEIQDLAREISVEMEKIYPVSWAALMGESK